jgi:hypothetical protein
MRTYKEEVSIKKITDKILCNCCGENAVYHETQNGAVDLFWECSLAIDWHDNGPFPSSSGYSSYDICRNCFIDKIKPLLSKIPPNESVLEDGKRITKP